MAGNSLGYRQQLRKALMNASKETYVDLPTGGQLAVPKKIAKLFRAGIFIGSVDLFPPKSPSDQAT